MAFLNFELEIEMNNEMKFTSQTPGALADAYYAADKAEKSAKATKDAIKTVLVERDGEGKYEGAVALANVLHPVKNDIKWQAVARALAVKANLTDKQLQTMIDANTVWADYWMVLVKPRVTLL
jgi:hypothetical protein